MKKKNKILKIVLFACVGLLCIGLVRAFIPKNPNGGNVINNNTNNDEPSIRGNYSSAYSANWKLTSNVGVLDLSVAEGIRPKRTEILGNG